MTFFEQDKWHSTHQMTERARCPPPVLEKMMRNLIKRLNPIQSEKLSIPDISILLQDFVGVNLHNMAKSRNQNNSGDNPGESHPKVTCSNLEKDTPFLPQQKYDPKGIIRPFYGFDGYRIQGPNPGT